MASELYDKISNAIKDAMKAHDNAKRDCLRSVLSEIKNQTINAGKEITDGICLKVLQKSVKTHNDSIEQFSNAGRDDLCAKEKAELEVISAFLPKMMTADEIAAFVKNFVQKLSDECGHKLSKKEMGLAMKQLNSQPEASQIDMKIALKTIASLLA